MPTSSTTVAEPRRWTGPLDHEETYMTELDGGTVNPRPRYEWRVQYRRRSWNYLQGRIYQSAPPAWRLTGKLHRKRPGLAPVVELYLQRRMVGEWEEIPDVEDLLDVDPRTKPKPKRRTTR